MSVHYIRNYPKPGAYEPCDVEPRHPSPRNLSYDEAVFLALMFLAGAAIVACVVLGLV